MHVLHRDTVRQLDPVVNADKPVKRLELYSLFCWRFGELTDEILSVALAVHTQQS